MKQLFQLDDHDLDELKRGHVYDIVLNGVVYGLSYAVSRRKWRSKKRHYEGLYEKYLDTSRPTAQCKLCGFKVKKGLHYRISAATHMRRKHRKQWEKEKIK